MKMKVKEEIAWLRRGPKAQRNKNKSRIKDAHLLIETYAQTRARTATDAAVDIEFSGTERKTRKLVAIHSLVKAMGDPETGAARLLIDKLNLVLSPGIKLGVLGPTGSRSRRFLKLLAGTLDPDAGTIKRAPDLRVVFFDQRRSGCWTASSCCGMHTRAGFRQRLLQRRSWSHLSAYARRFIFGYTGGKAAWIDRWASSPATSRHAVLINSRLMLTLHAGSCR